MPDPIRAAAPAALPTSGRAAAPAAIPTTSPAAPADRLALGGPAMLEADVAFRLAGGTRATANGRVRVDHRFIARYAAEAFKGSAAFRAVRLDWDPAARAYASTGTLKRFGLDVPFRTHMRLVAEAGHLGMAFDPMHVTLFGRELRVPDWVARRVIGEVAETARARGLRVQAEPERARVMADPGSLLRDLGLLPEALSLDTRKTALAVDTSPEGDVTLKLTSDEPAPALASTPGSDLALVADRPALTALLRQALAPDFALEAIVPRTDGFMLKGTAPYAPLSKVADGFKAIRFLLARANGKQRRNPSLTKARGPLELTVRAEGLRLAITPFPAMALDKLAESLAKAGLHPVKGDRVLYVDLQALLGGRPVTLERFELDGEGVRLRAQLDADALFR